VPILKAGIFHFVYLNHCKRRIALMGGEMFTAAVLSFTLILVGVGLGFLLLKIQGGEEESL
jgi:cytochrome b6-f complex subunit 7